MNGLTAANTAALSYNASAVNFTAQGISKCFLEFVKIIIPTLKNSLAYVQQRRRRSCM
jgi:hypothetical protein